MYVYKPHFWDGKWSVTVRENRSPQSKLVERVKCGNREHAWQTYVRIRDEIIAEERGYTFQARFVRDTEKALLLNVGGIELWFPRTLVTLKEEGVYITTYGFAKKKGIVK